jgi:hypothetical protein
MSQYGWADCPDNVRTQVNIFKDENFDEIALTGFALYMDKYIKALHDIRGQG